MLDRVHLVGTVQLAINNGDFLLKVASRKFFPKGLRGSLKALPHTEVCRELGGSVAALMLSCLSDFYHRELLPWNEFDDVVDFGQNSEQRGTAVFLNLRFFYPASRVCCSNFLNRSAVTPSRLSQGRGLLA